MSRVRLIMFIGLLLSCRFLEAMSPADVCCCQWLRRYWGYQAILSNDSIGLNNEQVLRERLLGQRSESYGSVGEIDIAAMDDASAVLHDIEVLIDKDELCFALKPDDLEGCYQEVFGCGSIDYDEVDDKELFLRDSAEMVLAGSIDYRREIQLAVKAFMYELVHREVWGNEELILARSRLNRVLLESHLRALARPGRALEKLCQLINGDSAAARCKAAVHLYYLSLQLLRDNNSQQVQLFALLAVFYWLDEQPSEQWYKVFNNHLKLLVRQRYDYAQDISLILFELYKDLDCLRFSLLALFSELYLSEYRFVDNDVVLRMLSVASEMLRDSEEEVAIESGMTPSHDSVAGFCRDSVKVSSSVLVMLESMVVAGIKEAIVPAFMAAQRACLTRVYNPSYKIESAISLEEYRLKGFSLLKQLALKRVFSCVVTRELHSSFKAIFRDESLEPRPPDRIISIARIIKKTKCSSSAKVFSGFKCRGSDHSLKLSIRIPVQVEFHEEVEFHEKSTAVIALRREVEEILKRG